MRRITAIIVGCLLALSLVAPASGGQSGREVTKQYTMANGMVIYESAHATWSLGTAWKTFRPRSAERLVSFTVSDDAGQDVLLHIHTDRNGDGKKEHLDFCTDTPKPLKLGATKKIEVAVFMGTCSDATPSIVTQGTITAIFSR